MLIIKRSGKEVAFDKAHIARAVAGANSDISDPTKRLRDREVAFVTDNVAESCEALGHTPAVEEVQDLVENELMRLGFYDVARAYVTYRFTRKMNREKNTTDDAILSLVARDNELVKQENSNKNPTINSVQRDYIAGEVSRDLTRRVLLPPEITRAHDEGVIHFHDADYFLQPMHNCDLINMDDMLQNGTNISGTHIDRPHSFLTACNIATQIIAQVGSNQYGGQSFSLAHLAKFVDVSRQRIRAQLADAAEQAGAPLAEAQLAAMVEAQVKREIASGIQTIQYQIVTLMTTNGQAPFVTEFLDIEEAEGDPQLEHDLALCIEETLNQRIRGLKDRTGAWVTPAFPKLIYALTEDNVDVHGRWYYLTELAARCTAKRMVPDYISTKVMRRDKLSAGEARGEGDVYPSMGCRSFLTPDPTGNGWNNVARAKNWEPNRPKYYGRFNQGVVTINLVDVALSANKDEAAFWRILDERLELCHRALQLRHKRLLGTPSDVAPILWQDGALARLEPGEVIDPLLFGGYSTISLGYAGLYECCMAMFGRSHTDPQAKPFALAVMQRMNDKCDEWKAKENIGYSLYGTPLESTTYKFAKCLQKRFGVIKDVTDHNYVTNSYHVNVREKIDAFTKLEFESEFQRLSPGGCISYVECTNLEDNVEAVLGIIRFIYDNIMYAELNTKSDHCDACGFDGEVEIVEREGKLGWRCPACGCEDQSFLHVARRTCGYIGTQFWNQGRTQEIRDRVVHVSVGDMDDAS